MSAWTEDQLKCQVQTLLQTAKADVLTKTEVHVDELGGRPDIGVSVRGTICGHVKLKVPGRGALTKKFKGRD